MMSKIGIDISKQWFDACCKRSQRSKRFDNNRQGFRKFSQWAGCGVHVIMEATGPYYLPLATWLYQQEVDVSVVNPLVIRRYSQMQLSRTKTDSKDAALIARYGAEQSPSLWQPSPRACRAIGQLLSLREGLVKQQTRLTNQQEAFSSEPTEEPLTTELIDDRLQQLETDIAKIDQRLQQLAAQHFSGLLELLQTIPGIGKQTAVVLIYITGGFTKFDDNRKLASYVGICPRLWQSGSSVKGRGSICKLGCGYLRKLLYVCSWSAKRYNPACKQMHQRLKQKGKPEKVINVAIAHKLLRQAFAVGTKREPFNKKKAMAA